MESVTQHLLSIMVLTISAKQSQSKKVPNLSMPSSFESNSNYICNFRSFNRRTINIFSIRRIVISLSIQGSEMFVQQGLMDDFFFYCTAFILPLSTIIKLFSTFPWRKRIISFQQIESWLLRFPGLLKFCIKGFNKKNERLLYNIFYDIVSLYTK